MDITIKWDNGKKSFIFPVNPESFDISESQNNTSIYIHNSGELNLKGKRSLRSVSWSCFFPNQDYNFLQTTRKTPEEYINLLKGLLEDNTTCELTIPSRLSMSCTIESFSYGESERNRDVSYSITFKEYRDIEKKRSSKESKKKMYKWKKGDTWSKVCKKQLGSSKGWQKVRSKKFNKKLIDKSILELKKANKKLPASKRKKVTESNALIGKKVLLKE